MFFAVNQNLNKFIFSCVIYKYPKGDIYDV